MVDSSVWSIRSCAEANASFAPMLSTRYGSSLTPSDLGATTFAPTPKPYVSAGLESVGDLPARFSIRTPASTKRHQYLASVAPVVEVAKTRLPPTDGSESSGVRRMPLAPRSVRQPESSSGSSEAAWISAPPTMPRSLSAERVHRKDFATGAGIVSYAHPARRFVGVGFVSGVSGQPKQHRGGGGKSYSMCHHQAPPPEPGKAAQGTLSLRVRRQSGAALHLRSALASSPQGGRAAQVGGEGAGWARRGASSPESRRAEACCPS